MNGQQVKKTNYIKEGHGPYFYYNRKGLSAQLFCSKGTIKAVAGQRRLESWEGTRINK